MSHHMDGTTKIIRALEAAIDDLRKQIPSVFRVNVSVDLWGYTLGKATTDHDWTIRDGSGAIVDSASSLTLAIEKVQRLLFPVPNETPSDDVPPNACALTERVSAWVATLTPADLLKRIKGEDE